MAPPDDADDVGAGGGSANNKGGGGGGGARAAAADAFLVGLKDFAAAMDPVVVGSSGSGAYFFGATYSSVDFSLAPWVQVRNDRPLFKPAPCLSRVFRRSFLFVLKKSLIMCQYHNHFFFMLLLYTCGSLFWGAIARALGLERIPRPAHSRLRNIR